MPKRNQINAIVTTRKSEADKAMAEMNKLLHKEALFTGRKRTYRPLDEVHGLRSSRLNPSAFNCVPMIFCAKR